MKFLITGGAGYIGSHVSYMLLDKGHDIVIIDNFSNSRAASIDAIEKLTNRKIYFYQGDISDPKMLSNVFKSHQFNAVIHFAALKSVSESILKPEKYYQNNVEGTSALISAMRSFEIKNLVFSSSATVYGVPKYLPIDENHPLSCTNPYAETKLAVEEILKKFCANDKSRSVVSLRYFNPVGAHESSLIGENPSDIPNNLMPYIVNVANKELPYLNIFGENYDTVDGTGVRDYIHVMDLAESHLMALNFIGLKAVSENFIESSFSNQGFNCFNVGTGKGCSVLQLIKIFEEVNNIKIAYRFTQRRHGDVASCYANVDKAKEVFQWTAKRSVEEMCYSAWEYKKSQI
jgi:UDP-glucose 4-epimerase